MKLAYQIALAAVVAGATAASTCAATFPFTDAKVEITSPENWKTTSEKDVVTLTAPDGEQAVVFILTPAGKEDKATNALDKLLEAKIGHVTWKDKPEKEQYNGMDAEVWEGTANEGKLEVEAAYIDTPADRYLVVYWFSKPGTDNKYEKDIDTIVKGLKPIGGAADKKEEAKEEKKE